MSMAPPAAAAELAAAIWAEPGAPIRQVGFGRTAVFELRRSDGRTIALRIHPAGSREAVIAVQRWTESLADAGFACPWPQRTRNGALVPELPGGIVSSAVQWLPGPLCPAGPGDLAAAAALLADLHLTSDAVAPADLNLPVPDLSAAEAPDSLAPAASADLSAAARQAAALLAGLPDALRGPIHGNARASRFVATGHTLYLTGFGHGRIGPRVMDLAALILSQADAASLPARRAEVWAAYRDGDGVLPAEAAPALDAALLLEALARAGTTPDRDRREAFLRLAQILSSANGRDIPMNRTSR